MTCTIFSPIKKTKNLRAKNVSEYDNQIYMMSSLCQDNMPIVSNETEARMTPKVVWTWCRTEKSLLEEAQVNDQNR
jgi:hypothetical protein